MTEDLLAPLRDPDVRPPRVDLHRAIRTGRRRRRIRNAAVAAVAVLAVTVAIGAVRSRPQAMPADRTPVPLPTSTIAPPFGECTISKETAPWAKWHPWFVLDDTWRVVVHLEARGTGPVEAVRYVDGAVERIPDVPSRFQVTNVNRAGDFAGVNGKVERGWVYRDGRFRALTLPKSATHLALTDINEAGDLLGAVDLGNPMGYEAAVWPGGRPDRPRMLKAPAGHVARATGIAWDGLIVGELVKGDVVTPYLWHPDGTGEPLPVPPEIGGKVEVTGLTGDWAVGSGVRWNIRTRHADVINGLSRRWAVVDMYGRVYGETDTPEHRQAVWVNGTLQPVPDRFEGQTAQPEAVRDDGRQLFGWSIPDNRPVRWDCG
ncbi:hypothetical protein [Dactylosporangium sp. NPDC050588]|uniref:hypothetical protein n=1 Tax=Dactylosporangium sp. NPDC050588 TaxID=3157211 RepID=UPI0033E1F181